MDRLRRLDALFAEKVLGCKVQDRPLGPECRCECTDVFGGSHPHGGLVHGTDPKICRYTRSLDAAWLSPPLFDIGVWHLSVVTQEGPCGPYRGLVTLERSDQPGGSTTRAATASHPAEALVLACLRAVGCTEDELA